MLLNSTFYYIHIHGLVFSVELKKIFPLSSSLLLKQKYNFLLYSYTQDFFEFVFSVASENERHFYHRSTRKR